MEAFEYWEKNLKVWTSRGTRPLHIRGLADVRQQPRRGRVGPQPRLGVRTDGVSSTMIEQDTWIRRDNGEETVIQLSGADVLVREGQRITFVAAKQPKVKTGFWVTLVNHATNRHWPLSSNAEMSLRGKLGAYPLVKWRDFMIAGAIFWVAQSLPAKMAHGSAVVVLFVVLSLPVASVVVRCWLCLRNRDPIFGPLDACA